MAQSRVTIIGTGLIGTSIGLALANSKDRSYEIVGIDRDRINARTAKKMGAIDREVGSLEEALSDAAVVFLAVPVMAARRLLQDMGPYVREGAIVTDTCSTKSDLMRWAAEYLPEGVHFIGGHPMAGREKSGPSAATADLFKGATWAIAPTARASEESVQVILGLVEAMGAIPFYIDGAEHDQWAAAVSHLPLLASVALFRMVRDSQGWEDAALIAGPGFKDMTRLASGDAVMSRDIMVTNRDAILHWLQRFEEELHKIRVALDEGGETIYEMFASTQLDRDVYITNPITHRKPEGTPAPSASDQMGSLLLGAGLYGKLKEMPNRPPERGKQDDAALRRKLGVRDDNGSR
jgi:prephenate dehydrogenase